MSEEKEKTYINIGPSIIYLTLAAGVVVPLKVGQTFTYAGHVTAQTKQGDPPSDIVVLEDEAT